ncbi:MAG: hypothetical protein EDQ89_00205 [Acidobacteria bacterium]|nr:MAG: hypothetical protein EDQ89_00205 [Acidobacteriota bacterium]
MATAITKRRTPPVNAELIEVSTSATVDDDGGGGGTGVAVTLWEGTAPAYVAEQVAFAELANAVQQEERTQVVIPSTLTLAGTAVAGGGTIVVARDGVEVGDLLTYTLRGGTAEHTRYITSLEDRADLGYVRTWTTEL